MYRHIGVTKSPSKDLMLTPVSDKIKKGKLSLAADVTLST